MAPLAQDIRSAREAIELLLEELGLRAFVYTVERTEARWVLSIECATDGDWQAVAFSVDPDELRASLEDASLRAKLKAEWAPRLRSCATEHAAPRKATEGG